MTKLSLDSEPPPRFRGEKEVNRKKNGTLHQLIISVKNEKSKDKIAGNEKNLEKRIKHNLQEYFFDGNYLNANEKINERTSTTARYIEFKSTSSIASIADDKSTKNFSYEQEKNNISSTWEKNLKFYDINSSYSFMPEMRKEDREENKQEDKENEQSKEAKYMLYKFEEEKKEEEIGIISVFLVNQKV